MSRLIDKLDKSKKATSHPMGFRATREDADESRLFLIASIPVNVADKISECVTGADAALLKATGSSLSVKSVQEIVEAIPGVPVGISIKDIGKTKIDSYLQSGGDFLVFSAESPVDLTSQEEKIGKLLQIDPSMEDSLVRIVNNLPVDAVITTELFKNVEAITWQQLMVIQRLALLITKPVIIPVSAGISPGELQAIRDADIDGILVEVDAAEPGKLEKIRQAIKKLPPKSTRKPEKSDVLLPRNSATESAIPDEEDDYE